MINCRYMHYANMIFQYICMWYIYSYKSTYEIIGTFLNVTILLWSHTIYDTFFLPQSRQLCQATAAWLGILWTKSLVGSEAGSQLKIMRCQNSLTTWWFQTFFFGSPRSFGGNDPIWRVAFKWGANHQPVERNMTCFKMFWHWICVFLDTPKMPCMSMRMKAMEIKICQLPSTDSGRNLSFNRWLLQASVLPNTFASWSVAFVFFDLEIFLHHFKVTLICLIFWCSWYWFHLIYHLIYH